MSSKKLKASKIRSSKTDSKKLALKKSSQKSAVPRKSSKNVATSTSPSSNLSSKQEKSSKNNSTSSRYVSIRRIPKNKAEKSLIDKLNEMTQEEAMQLKKEYDQAIIDDRRRAIVIGLFCLVVLMLVAAFGAVVAYFLLQKIVEENELTNANITLPTVEIEMMASEQMTTTSKPRKDLVQLCEEKIGTVASTHRTKYPPSCRTTSCFRIETILTRFQDNFKLESEDGWLKSEDFKDDGIRVPDLTPCDKTAWCINRECIETNDSQVEAFGRIPYPSYDSTWVDTCAHTNIRYPATADIYEKQRSRTSCPNEKDRVLECKKDKLRRYTFDIVKINFLMPKPHWTGDSKYMSDIKLYTGFVPWYISGFCHECNKTNVDDYFEKYNCSLWRPKTNTIYDLQYDCFYTCTINHTKPYKVYSLPTGTPCPIKSVTKISTQGYCAFGFCMPIYNEAEPYYYFSRHPDYCRE